MSKSPEAKDVHAEVAAEVFGKKPSEVTASERSSAQAIAFGALYGSPDRIKDILGVKPKKTRR